MPTYEYRCRSCSHAFELFQRMSDAPATSCPECGLDEAERRISAGAGFVFKGPGFYATDYRDPPPSATRSKGADSEEDGSKSDGAADGAAGGNGKGAAGGGAKAGAGSEAGDAGGGRDS